MELHELFPDAEDRVIDDSEFSFIMRFRAACIEIRKFLMDVIEHMWFLLID